LHSPADRRLRLRRYGMAAAHHASKSIEVLAEPRSSQGIMLQEKGADNLRVPHRQ
jgi:hypothetical protein